MYGSSKALLLRSGSMINFNGTEDNSLLQCVKANEYELLNIIPIEKYGNSVQNISSE